MQARVNVVSGAVIENFQHNVNALERSDIEAGNISLSTFRMTTAPYIEVHTHFVQVQPERSIFMNVSVTEKTEASGIRSISLSGKSKSKNISTPIVNENFIMVVEYY